MTDSVKFAIEKKGNCVEPLFHIPHFVRVTFGRWIESSQIEFLNEFEEVRSSCHLSELRYGVRKTSPKRPDIQDIELQ